MAGSSLREFEAAYRHLAPDVRRFLAGRVHADDLDEAVAATFVTAWNKHRAGPSEPDRYRAWIFTIARFEARNQQRSRRRRQQLSERASLRSTLSDHLCPDAAAAADDALGEALARAVDELGPDDHALLVLVALRGHNLRDAAAELGWTHGATRMRMVRLRSRLQSVLQRGDTAADGIDE